MDYEELIWGGGGSLQNKLSDFVDLKIPKLVYSMCAWFTSMINKTSQKTH